MKKIILKVECESIFSNFGTADLHFLWSRKQRHLVSMWKVPEETWKHRSGE